MITSYSELSISKYQEIKDMLKDEYEPLDLQVKLVSILSDKSEDEILNMNINDYHDLVQKTDFLMKPPQPVKKVPNKIVINGKKYIISKDVSRFTTAQYIDYQTLTAKEDREKYLQYILACFLVPEGHKYNDGYLVDEVAKEIEDNVSIQDAFNVCFFFQLKYLNLINDFLIYSDWKTKRMMRKTKDETTRKSLMEAREKMKQLRDLVQSGISSSSSMK